MAYGYSILMGLFSGALLLYAGLMALFKDYKILPLRVRRTVKPKNEKLYMTQLAKVVALVAAAPALSALAGLWHPFIGLAVLIGAGIFFIWLGTKCMHYTD